MVARLDTRCAASIVRCHASVSLADGGIPNSSPNNWKRMFTPPIVVSIRVVYWKIEQQAYLLNFAAKPIIHVQLRKSISCRRILMIPHDAIRYPEYLMIGGANQYMKEDFRLSRDREGQLQHTSNTVAISSSKFGGNKMMVAARCSGLDSCSHNASFPSMSTRKWQ